MDERDTGERAGDLRCRAEEVIGRTRGPSDLDALPPEQIRQAFHELHVHRVELEMQNEELRRTQVELDTARARYFDLFDLAPVGYLTLDGNRIVLEANLTFARMVGQPKSALVQQAMSRFILPEDQDVWYRHCRFEGDAGIPRSCELQLLHAGGEPFWARLETRSPQDDDPAKAFHVVVMDISDRKRAERDRLRFEAAARQQQKLESIGTLAAGVAHEINNPLNVVMNYCQLLADDPSDTDHVKEYAENILRESERVAVIVRQLLGFARKGGDHPVPVSLGGFVEETLSLMRPLLRKFQITIDSELPGALPAVRCRPQQIQQVLVNLLSNARDALNERCPDRSDEKVVRITASAFERDGTRWVRLNVEDRGNGIRPEVADRVFDPFFTTKGRAMGTGLGLSISRDIVREHQGQLWFETEPGRGTTFHIDLPVGMGAP